MAIKGKVTRLSDPKNPYGGKKTPTGRPQDRPKPAAAKKATPAERKKPSFMDTAKAAMQDLSEAPSRKMKRANKEYMDARKEKIERGLRRSGA